MALRTASGTAYYVDGDFGDNGNTGLVGQPKATVQAGLNLLTANDTLYIAEKAGGYSEALTLTTSGTDDSNPIVIKNYLTESPVINGETGQRLVWHISGDYVTLDGMTSWHTDPPVGDNNATVTTMINVTGDNFEVGNDVQINPTYADNPEDEKSNENYVTMHANLAANDKYIEGVYWKGASGARAVNLGDTGNVRSYLVDCFIGDCFDTHLKAGDALRANPKLMVVDHCHFANPYSEDCFQTGGNADVFGCRGLFFLNSLFEGDVGEQAFDFKDNDEVLIQNCVSWGHPSNNDGPLTNPTANNGGGLLNRGSNSDGVDIAICRNNFAFQNNGAARFERRNQLYHNTLIQNNKSLMTTIDNPATMLTRGNHNGVHIQNNLFAYITGTVGGSGGHIVSNASGTITIDNNHYHSAGTNWWRNSNSGDNETLATWQAKGFDANATTGDPVFENVPADGAMSDANPFNNYNIAVDVATSPVYQSAAALTLVNGDTTTSNDVTVDSALFFHDGWGSGVGVVPAIVDRIYIDGLGTARNITAISGNVITFDGAAASLSNNAEVWWHPYSDSAKDVGLYHIGICWESGVDEFGANTDNGLEQRYPATALQSFAGVADQPVITSAGASLYDGSTSDILGVEFNATQGTGTVELTEFSDGTGRFGTFSGYTWADESITNALLDINTLVVGDTPWVRVTHDNGNISAPFQITIVAVPSGGLVAPVYQSDTTQSFATGGNLTVAEPAGTVEGDLLIAIQSNQNATIPTLNTGWTDIQNGGANTLAIRVSYVIRGVSAPDLVFTSGQSSVDAQVALLRINKTDAAAPINVSAITLDGDKDNDNTDAPTVTTTEINTLVLRIGTARKNNLALDTTTEIYKKTPQSGLIIIVGSEEQATADATGVETISHVSSTGVLHTVTVALKGEVDDVMPTVNGRELGSVNKNTGLLTTTLANVFLTSIDPTGNGLTIDSISGQIGGTWAVNGTSGNLEFTPTTDFSGEASANITGIDSASNTDSGNFTITVVNRAPVITRTPLVTVSGQTTDFTIIANELDGDSVTWSIVSQPTSGTLSVLDAATGSFRYVADTDMPPVVSDAVVRATDDDATPLAADSIYTFQLLLTPYQSNIFISDLFTKGIIH